MKHRLSLKTLKHSVQSLSLSLCSLSTQEVLRLMIVTTIFLLLLEVYAHGINSRNGVNVEGATHRHVVDLIKHGGDRLTMIVISVEDSEVDR